MLHCSPRALRSVFVLLALAAGLTASAALAVAPRFEPAAGTLTAQGLFSPRSGQAVSPQGNYRMEFTLSAAPENRLLAEVTVTDPRGRTWALHGIPGPALFLSDLGRVAALETFDPPEIPGRLRIYDLDGRLLREESLPVATDPVLSPDGTRILCRTLEGVADLDLATGARRLYPVYALFAAGPDGAVAGVTDGGRLEVHGTHPFVLPLDGRAVRLAFEGASVLVLDPARLQRIDPATGRSEVLYTASSSEELRDLEIAAGAVRIGIRRTDGDAATGSAVVLAGGTLAREQGPTVRTPRADFWGDAHASGAPAGAAGGSAGGADLTVPSVPWPLLPNAQHSVGNTYNEYQNYGGSPYPHPGHDIFGSANQAVYAVHSGVVKAVLTTGGDLYWRIAIADTTGNGTLPGYLYAHIAYGTIAVTVGQAITEGQYIGGLVQWPGWNFTHTHFARVQDTGSQWYGSWITIGNAHMYMQNQTENTVPIFEPARGTELLAFCANNTSNYQASNQIHGAVDIIAHVGDTIASTWVCTVQELRYTIYPQGHPDAPVVSNKLAVDFDMMNDYYAGGPNWSLLTNILYKQDTTCRTQGDYDFREFYHILTNSDGDQSWGQEDITQSWDTSLLPDGYYIVRVRARDVAGNVTTDSMTVRTVNGNPSSVPEPGAPVLAQSRPNPAHGPVTISFTTASAGNAELGVYDAAGRRVRALFAGTVPAGTRSLVWDGRTDAGSIAPAGLYFYRLSSPDGARTGRIVFRP